LLTSSPAFAIHHTSTREGGALDRCTGPVSWEGGAHPGREAEKTKDLLWSLGGSWAMVHIANLCVCCLPVSMVYTALMSYPCGGARAFLRRCLFIYRLLEVSSLWHSSCAPQVSVLVQCLTLRIPLAASSLVSDSIYIAQNAPRLFRAIAEIAFMRSLPIAAEKALNWAQVVFLCYVFCRVQ
jgi:hypothetical protein